MIIFPSLYFTYSLVSGNLLCVNIVKTVNMVIFNENCGPSDVK